MGIVVVVETEGVCGGVDDAADFRGGETREGFVYCCDAGGGVRDADGGEDLVDTGLCLDLGGVDLVMLVMMQR